MQLKLLNMKKIKRDSKCNGNLCFILLIMGKICVTADTKMCLLHH